MGTSASRTKSDAERKLLDPTGSEDDTNNRDTSITDLESASINEETGVCRKNTSSRQRRATKHGRNDAAVKHSSLGRLISLSKLLIVDESCLMMPFGRPTYYIL